MKRLSARQKCSEDDAPKTCCSCSCAQVSIGYRSIAPCVCGVARSQTWQQWPVSCEMEQASSARALGGFCRLLGSLLVRALQGGAGGVC